MTEGFNPKCNQFVDPPGGSESMPSCAEVAERQMQKHADHRAQQAAYERAKAERRGANQKARATTRWLSPNDLRR